MVYAGQAENFRPARQRPFLIIGAVSLVKIARLHQPTIPNEHLPLSPSNLLYNFSRLARPNLRLFETERLT